MIDITDMDYIRGALANALCEDMSLADVYRCAEHAETPNAFDDAVNVLAQTMDSGETIDESIVALCRHPR